ncbi:hypothetical protein J4709_44475 [Actinomadura sp. LCR2-06]|uniref:Uncharacterized protein n=1 Tax=Actinomadura violacea TaxID=2819934 RepID=A0ABS3S8S9_9ACTN|nr:hypothetical protein [Actinomadura violacea]
MAMAKKGSRRITVAGLEFRWKVRGRPTYDQALGWTPLTFAAERAAEPGALLVVSMRCAHPSNWLGLPATPVLPRTVAAAINTALQRGWQPSQPGPPFVLDDLH